MDKLWILDFGCSNHMMGRKEFSHNLTSTYPYIIGLSNGATVVAVQKSNGRLNPEFKIPNMLLIPNLKFNLISLA